MESKKCPVDVISVCHADGQIRPLRLQFEDESRQCLRINIDQILSMREITHVGAEAQVYLCRARVWDRTWTFELKYHIRGHNWTICREN